MSNLSITEAPRTPEYIVNTSQSGGTSESQGVHEGRVLGVGDNVETSGNKGMPKLTPILYEIKDGDSLMKIAGELGLKITDLVDQLKASGKLPKDYDPFVQHKKDIPWMKKGNKIKLSYPETEEQKAKYEEFCEQRTKDYYNRKAAAERKAKAEAKAKARAEYDALPWFKKLFTERP